MRSLAKEFEQIGGADASSTEPEKEERDNDETDRQGGEVNVACHMWD